MGRRREEDGGICGEGKTETRALGLWTRGFFLDTCEGKLFFARRNDSNDHRGP